MNIHHYILLFFIVYWPHIFHVLSGVYTFIKGCIVFEEDIKPWFEYWKKMHVVFWPLRARVKSKLHQRKGKYLN